MSWRRLYLAPFVLCLMGAGPILVDTEGSGAGVAWKDGIVHFNLESGAEATLGRLSNEEARSLVNELFEDWRDLTWEGVAVTDFTLEEGGDLASIDAGNTDAVFSYCPPDEDCPGEDPPFVLGTAGSGESPILFDSDGAITDLIQGEGAKASVIGFAGPRVVDRFGGVLSITEGQAVLNGLFIDCPEGVSSDDDCQTPEITLEEFKGAIFHELGHFLGLDHSQVNLSSAVKALSGDMSEIEGVPTMLPLLINGAEQATPHFDDIVSLALLYPSPEFTSSFCTLEGTVFKADGSTELQGVNVVAKRGDNPLVEATSFVSGQLFTGSSKNCDAAFGDFSIQGLTPGASYTLQIEKISKAFTGGSSIEPCDPSQSGFEETTLAGSFSCTTAGQVITTGTQSDTKIVTTKGATAETPASTGGCSLIR